MLWLQLSNVVLSLILLVPGTELDSLDRDGLRSIAKSYIRFFQPSANFENSAKLGIHAKFCVVDANHAYIGSANLTKPGLEEHFEMGIFSTRKYSFASGCFVEIFGRERFFH